MSIKKIILINSQGGCELDTKEVTLEYLAFSDDLADFPLSIAAEGINKESGWQEPGTAYQLGNDHAPLCYAGRIDVFDRKIIGGSGDYDFTLNGNEITIVRQTNDAPLVQWKVRQSFSTKGEKKESGTEPSVDDKVTVTTSVELEEIPFDRDVVNPSTLVQNSAGMGFNPPATRQRRIPVFNITRRELGNPINKSLAFSNTVNNSAFWGQPAGTLLMDSIQCAFDGERWQVTYPIKYKPEGWAVELLDAGYYYRAGDGKLYPILGDDGLPVSEPAKLNGQGGVMINQTAQGHNVGPFKRYTETDFSLLYLPNIFTLHEI